MLEVDDLLHARIHHSALGRNQLLPLVRAAVEEAAVHLQRSTARSAHRQLLLLVRAAVEEAAVHLQRPTSLTAQPMAQCRPSMQKGLIQAESPHLHAAHGPLGTGARHAVVCIGKWMGGSVLHLALLILQ